MLIELTTYAITHEEARYTLSGAQFELYKQNVKMATPDSHRLAYVATESAHGGSETLDVWLPRAALAELTRLPSDFDGVINLGADEKHVYFQVGSRLLISRLLSGQFRRYEMVMPKGND